jgi:hypothetical protein
VRRCARPTIANVEIPIATSRLPVTSHRITSAPVRPRRSPSTVVDGEGLAGGRTVSVGRTLVLGVGEGDGEDVSVSVGRTVGDGVGVGVSVSVGLGVGVGLAVSVGDTVGLGVGVGVEASTS